MKKKFTIIVIVLAAIFSTTKFIENKGLARSRIFGAANVYADNKSFVNGDINALSTTSLLIYAITVALEHVMETDTDAVDAVLAATETTADVYVTVDELAEAAAVLAAEAAAVTTAVGGLIGKETYPSNINTYVAMTNLD